MTTMTPKREDLIQNSICAGKISNELKDQHWSLHWCKMQTHIV